MALAPFELLANVLLSGAAVSVDLIWTSELEIPAGESDLVEAEGTTVFSPNKAKLISVALFSPPDVRREVTSSVATLAADETLRRLLGVWETFNVPERDVTPVGTNSVALSEPPRLN